MPAAFNNCRKGGGNIVTISGPDKDFKVPEGYYRKVCWLNDKPHRGELHKKSVKKKVLQKLK